MGMTIDDCIKIIKFWLNNGTDGLTDTRLGYMEGWFHKTDKEAFETAIETMRKYQKIKQIYREWFSDTGRTSADAYERIGEVIEDAKE